MRKAHTKKNDKLREDCVEEIDTWKGVAFESEYTFGRELDEVVIQALLRTSERDSAHARYHEMLAALRRTVKVRGK